MRRLPGTSGQGREGRGPRAMPPSLASTRVARGPRWSGSRSIAMIAPPPPRSSIVASSPAAPSSASSAQRWRGRSDSRQSGGIPSPPATRSAPPTASSIAAPPSPAGTTHAPTSSRGRWLAHAGRTADGGRVIMSCARSEEVLADDQRWTPPIEPSSLSCGKSGDPPTSRPSRHVSGDSDRSDSGTTSPGWASTKTWMVPLSKTPLT